MLLANITSPFEFSLTGRAEAGRAIRKFATACILSASLLHPSLSNTASHQPSRVHQGTRLLPFLSSISFVLSLPLSGVSAVSVRCLPHRQAPQISSISSPTTFPPTPRKHRKACIKEYPSSHRRTHLSRTATEAVRQKLRLYKLISLCAQLAFAKAFQQFWSSSQHQRAGLFALLSGTFQYSVTLLLSSLRHQQQWPSRPPPYRARPSLHHQRLAPLQGRAATEMAPRVTCRRRSTSRRTTAPLALAQILCLR